MMTSGKSFVALAMLLAVANASCMVCTSRLTPGNRDRRGNKLVCGKCLAEVKQAFRQNKQKCTINNEDPQSACCAEGKGTHPCDSNGYKLTSGKCVCKLCASHYFGCGNLQQALQELLSPNAPRSRSASPSNSGGSRSRSGSHVRRLLSGRRRKMLRHKRRRLLRQLVSIQR